MTPASMHIPSFDPIPMPAPEPLVHGLLVVTVLLHALFVNLVLGSTPIMVVTEWLGQRKGSDRFQRLARTLSSISPTAMALAIVLGVAPLLFIQILYGQLFYTAAILGGGVWILLILVLILAHYGLYLYKSRQPWLLDKPVRSAQSILLTHSSAKRYSASLDRPQHLRYVNGHCQSSNQRAPARFEITGLCEGCAGCSAFAGATVAGYGPPAVVRLSRSASAWTADPGI